MNKVLLLVVLLNFVKIYSFQTSSESVNPFNQFMSPSGGINAFSGDVAYSHQIATLTGRNGMNIGVGLSYSSNVHINIRARNDVAPGGWCGTGWNLNYGSIRCNHKGTKIHDDDEFMWLSPAGFGSKILKKDGKYFIQQDPYSKIEPQDVNDDGVFDGWIVTGSDGKKMKYGNLNLSGDRKATRWTFSWSNYVGTGTSGTPTPYPYQWDVSEMQDIAGNTIKFYYQPETEYFKVGSWISPIPYTKASYPFKIVSPEGKRVEFVLESKGNEVFDPYAFESEPDGFMEMVESKRLKKVKVFNKPGAVTPVAVYVLDYMSINENQLGTEFKKGLLSSIDTYNGDESRKLTGTIFEYNTDFNKADKSHASYDADYNYGALASMHSGEGGTTAFTYERKTINIENFVRKDFIHTEVQKTYAGYLKDGLPYVLFRGGTAYDRVWAYHWTGSNWDLKLEYEDLIGGRSIDGIYPGVNYFALRGATNSDRVWVYEWDGQNWGVAKRDGGVDFEYQSLGSTGSGKRVFPGSEHMMIVGGKSPNPIEEKDRVWMFDWDGYEWKTAQYEHLKSDGTLEIRNYWYQNFDNEYEKSITWISPNDVVIRGGHDRDRLYVFHYDGSIWRLAKRDGQYFWYDKFEEGGGSRTIYPLGNDRFAVVGGEDGDRLWVLVWNGNEWEYARYKGTDDITREMRYLTLGRGTNGESYYLPKQIVGLNFSQFAVLAGARLDRVSVLVWSGGVYEVAEAAIGGVTEDLYDYSFGRTTSSPPEDYTPKTITPNGNHFIVRAGKTGDRISVMSWNGSKWITRKTDAGSTEDFYDKALSGSNSAVRIVANGNNTAFVYGDDHDRVWAFRWNGASWETAKILQHGGTTPVDFRYLTLSSNSGKNPYLGDETFVLRGGSPDKDLVWALVWDGQKWLSRQWDTNYNNSYDKTIHNGGRYFTIRGGDDGNRVWFFYKFQDQVDQPVYSYVVKQKTLSGGFGQPDVTVSFKYDDPSSPNPSNPEGNYDTNAGTAKFNKVETIVPSGGKVVQYHFNDTHADNQHQKCSDFGKLDGQVYRTATFNQANAPTESSPISESATDHFLYANATWPPDVYQKRVSGSSSKINGVTSGNDILLYNNTNGLPVISRTKNSDGKQRLSKTYFAYENSAYSAAMGATGMHMLIQPCQTVVYEKAAGDASIQPLPSEIRSAQATTYSNGLDCTAWLPHKTYVWKSDFDSSGDPEETFDDFDHTSGASNPNWLLTGIVERYTPDGRGSETSKVISNNRKIHSSTVYGYNGAKVTGSITKAHFEECGVFTGDYQCSEDPAAWWDRENGWEKGENDPANGKVGPILASDNIHFGQQSIKVVKNYAATRNCRVYPGKAYTMTAWVKVTDGTGCIRMDGGFRKLINAAATWPYDWSTDLSPADPTLPDIPQATPVYESDCNGSWKLMTMEIPADLTRQLDAGETWYCRAWVGEDPGNSANPTFTAYVDDVRFAPSDAMVSSTYYNQLWHQPIISVDANNNPGYKVTYDSFGRPVLWEQFDPTTTATLRIQEKTYHLRNELPAGETIALLSPDGGESFTAGSYTTVRWVNAGTENIDLSYYPAGSGSTTPIGNTIPAHSGWGSATWQVPTTPGTYFVRAEISGTTTHDESDRAVTVVAP